MTMFINAIAMETGLTHRTIHIRIVLERIPVTRFGKLYLIAKSEAERLVKVHEGGGIYIHTSPGARSDVMLLPPEAQERFRQYELAGLITIVDRRPLAMQESNGKGIEALHQTDLFLAGKSSSPINTKNIKSFAGLRRDETG